MKKPPQRQGHYRSGGPAQDALDYACSVGRHAGGHDLGNSRFASVRAKHLSASPLVPVPAGMIHLNGGGLEGVKREAVMEALKRSGGRVTVAAGMLKIRRDTLYHMKKKYALSVLVLLALVAPSWAASLTNTGSATLAWDRSPDDNATNILTYRIFAGTSFASTTNASLSTTNVFAGTNTTITITNLVPGLWYFTGRAIQGGVESDSSGYTSYIVPSAKPRPPGTPITIILESTLDFTNWTDVGSFRARLTIAPPQ